MSTGSEGNYKLMKRNLEDISLDDVNGVLGHTLRCNKNRNHEFSVRTNSFFENSKFTVQDTLQFIRSYLEQGSLKPSLIGYWHVLQKCSSTVGCFCREICAEYVWKNIYQNPIR